MMRLGSLYLFRRERRPPGEIGIRDSRHSDHSKRAHALREEYRLASRGVAVPRPSRPPGYDDATEPPGYRKDPRNGEVTVDMNSKDKRPRLSLPSQGRACHDSEHYYDGLLPFRRSGPSNPPAPPYPMQVPARRENPAQAKYLPFPHEKDVPLEEALARTPRNRSLEAPRRAPRAEGARPPWHRRINWDAVARALAAGFGYGYYDPPPR